MTPKVGKTYKVVHSRKGTFIGECVSVDDDFATFMIVGGTAKYMGEENRTSGEKVAVRLEFCSLSEVKP